MGNSDQKNDDNNSNNKIDSFQEFYCPKCEEKPSEIAEILNIHSDSGNIVIECPKKGEDHILTLENYNEKMKDSNNNKNFKCHYKDCNNQSGEQNDNVYCPKCKCFLCKECILKDELEYKAEYNKQIAKIKNNKKCGFWCFWRLSCVNDNKHPNECIHIHIKQNELSTTCPNHGLKTNQYCEECEKFVCEKCSEKYHCRHAIKNLSAIKKEVEEAKKTIRENDEKLKIMKNFYEMVKNSYETNTNNNIYKKNIVNVAECIENEKKRDNYDIDLALYKLRQMNRNHQMDQKKNKKKKMNK